MAGGSASGLPSHSELPAWMGGGKREGERERDRETERQSERSRDRSEAFNGRGSRRCCRLEREPHQLI